MTVLMNHLSQESFKRNLPAFFSSPEHELNFACLHCFYSLALIIQAG